MIRKPIQFQCLVLCCLHRLQPCQEMHCMQNQRGQLKVFKCGVFHHAWSVPREPSLSSYNLTHLPPLLFLHSPAPSSAESSSTRSSSVLSLSGNKCLCNRLVRKRKKRYNENVSQTTLEKGHLNRRKRDETSRKDFYQNGVLVCALLWCWI